MRIPTTLAALALASVGLIGTAGTAAADTDSDQNTSAPSTLLCNRGTGVLALPVGQAACKVLPHGPASRKQ